MLDRRAAQVSARHANCVTVWYAARINALMDPVDALVDRSSVRAVCFAPVMTLGPRGAASSLAVARPDMQGV